MIGTVLGNRYELEEKVGIGGMAVVYKAMDKLLNRYVAVKLLRSEFQDNEEFIRRFNIESQAAASLSHANIVSIYDVGQSGNLQYIVMEFIEGTTLKDYIEEKKGNVYWKDATNIAMQICSALEHAHSKHIIHRDIKPQNIMINNEGIVKVTDFGIARAASGGTTTMEAMGSAHYLSPEQARGGYTDQKSDIYSLGVVLYELYTGQLPFDGETPVAVAMQHMQADPIKPRNIKSDIPKSVENIILKAMSKEQRLRYDNASLMLNDIKRAYTDPDVALKGDEDETEKFGTKKMPPIVNITIPGEGAKSVVRRTEEDRVTMAKTTKSKKKKKKDTAVIVAAIITCFVIACVMGIVVAIAMNRSRTNNEKEEVVQTYEMPNVKGTTIRKAQNSLDTLRAAGFDITEQYVFDLYQEKGVVLAQSPAMGPIEIGTPIVLTVSSGKEQIKLEDYAGMQEEEAVNALEDSGLVVSRFNEPNDEFEKGVVIRTFPSSGSPVETGETVFLYVSAGAELFELGDYSGMVLAEAQTSLAKMTVTVVEEHDDTVPAGSVVRQSPEPATEVKKGDEVTLYVSKGPAPIYMPDLVGLPLDQAKDALSNNHLKLGGVTEVTNANPAGTVVWQDKTAGDEIARDSVVNIKVSRGEDTVIPEPDNGSEGDGGGNGNNTSDNGL